MQFANIAIAVGFGLFYVDLALQITALVAIYAGLAFYYRKRT